LFFLALIPSREIWDWNVFGFFALEDLFDLSVYTLASKAPGMGVGVGGTRRRCRPFQPNTDYYLRPRDWIGRY